MKSLFDVPENESQSVVPEKPVSKSATLLPVDQPPVSKSATHFSKSATLPVGSVTSQNSENPGEKSEVLKSATQNSGETDPISKSATLNPEGVESSGKYETLLADQVIPFAPDAFTPSTTAEILQLLNSVGMTLSLAFDSDGDLALLVKPVVAPAFVEIIRARKAELIEHLYDLEFELTMTTFEQMTRSLAPTDPVIPRLNDLAGQVMDVHGLMRLQIALVRTYKDRINPQYECFEGIELSLHKGGKEG